MPPVLFLRPRGHPPSARSGTPAPAARPESLADNNEWASLGGGTYTPLCPSWVVTASSHTYTLRPN